jgi:asparagine synthase (glutamine-hydrolysing)
LFDLQYYLKDDLLVKVDRASMYHALECRSPLLDHSIVAFALSLHCDLKKSNGTSKWILKEMLAQYLPPDLIHRQKWGFSIPLASWLKGDLRYLVEDYLNDTTIEAIGLFDARYIKQLVAEFFGGKEYLYNRLWVLIVLHKWIKDNAA